MYVSQTILSFFGIFFWFATFLKSRLYLYNLYLYMYRSSTGIGLIFKCLPTCPIDTLISLQVTMLLCGLAMMGFPISKKELCGIMMWHHKLSTNTHTFTRKIVIVDHEQCYLKITKKLS